MGLRVIYSNSYSVFGSGGGIVAADGLAGVTPFAIVRGGVWRWEWMETWGDWGYSKNWRERRVAREESHEGCNEIPLCPYFFSRYTVA